MTSTKSITLITGGNGGIGLEVANQLLQDSSKYVLLASRSKEKGEAAVKELKAKHSSANIEVLELDVNSEVSIFAAAKTVEQKYGRIDALVNNAAVAVVSGSTAEQMIQCFQTNAIGPVLMLEAFGSLLKKSTGIPRVVNVTTDQASIAGRLDPNFPGHELSAIPYRASKVALNMVTACQVVEYSDAGFKVFAYNPGFTSSNLSQFNNAENGAKPTSEGAAPIVQLLNGERDEENGQFVQADGQLPW